MNVTTEPVPYRDGGAALTGVLARPAVGGNPVGVIVVHGGAGLDDHAREQAMRYAALGYPVFACDMYGDGVAGDREQVMAAINKLRQDRIALRARVDAAVATLSGLAPHIDRHAVFGYCFGGLVALEYARSGADAAAIVSVHGTLATDAPAEPGAVRARVLVCHGALDPHVPPGDLTAFITEMDEANADWQLNIYGGAMHGFTHRTALTAANGVAYHPAADARSFAAAQRLLEETLARTPF